MHSLLKYKCDNKYLGIYYSCSIVSPTSFLSTSRIIGGSQS
nr:MAG TPA: HybE-like protein [Bacteriophage sp.]